MRKSRDAEFAIRSCRVTVSAPQHLRNRKDVVTMNVVLVSEMNPPEGEQPIEWVLLTTLPIAVSAELFAEPEFDRTSLEVREEKVSVQCLL